MERGRGKLHYIHTCGEGEGEATLHTHLWRGGGGSYTTYTPVGGGGGSYTTYTPVGGGGGSYTTYTPVGGGGGSYTTYTPVGGGGEATLHTHLWEGRKLQPGGGREATTWGREGSYNLGEGGRGLGSGGVLPAEDADILT